jgi:hypothetical protein
MARNFKCLILELSNLTYRFRVYTNFYSKLISVVNIAGVRSLFQPFVRPGNM